VAADLDAVIALMPLAADLGIALEEATADRVVLVAQTTQIQAVRTPAKDSRPP